MPQKLVLKGIREGLLAILSDGEWSDVRQELLAHIDGQADFLKGGRLALDVGNQVLKAVEMGSLRDALSERGLSLWAVIGNSPTTEKTAQTLGMATRLSKPLPDRAMHTLDTNIQSGEQGTLVRRTLRSGFSLHHPGHVVVIGDVNPGAEVVAGGDVLVWGRLRGMVHAGAEGKEDAVVCALELAPTQLRIAGKIAISPQRRPKSQPEMAYIKDGQVTSVSWNPKERK
jgi:septum site-determining protein MinC